MKKTFLLFGCWVLFSNIPFPAYANQPVVYSRATAEVILELPGIDWDVGKGEVEVSPFFQLGSEFVWHGFPQVGAGLGFEGPDLHLHVGAGYNSHEEETMFLFGLHGAIGNTFFSLHADLSNSEQHGKVKAGYGVLSFLDFGAEVECAVHTENSWCGLGPYLTLSHEETSVSFSVLGSEVEYPTYNFRYTAIMPTINLQYTGHVL